MVAFTIIGSLLVGVVLGLLLGFKVGFDIGKRYGVLSARTLRLRRRRPLTISVDLALIQAAATGAGYELVREHGQVH